MNTKKRKFCYHCGRELRGQAYGVCKVCTLTVCVDCLYKHQKEHKFYKDIFKGEK